MNIEQLKRIINTEAGRELQEYIISKINELNHINELKLSRNPIKTTIEVKAANKAMEKLLEIFDFINSVGVTVN